MNIKKIIKSARPLLIIFAVVLFALLIFAKPNKENTPEGPFPKGLLVINTDKSVYSPGEKVELGLVSLDPNGDTLCDSDLVLEIEDPSGNKIEFATGNNTISKSTTCSPENNVTNDPDYRAYFTAVKKGNYTLTVKNMQTGAAGKNSIQVLSGNAYSIRRTGATRLNPFKSQRYPMTLTVTAEKDFTGTLVERIPGSFNVVWQGNAVVASDAASRILTWDLELKAGESREFIYEYGSPRISPEFYELGKAALFNKDGEVFTETRTWQIANDASRLYLPSTGTAGITPSVSSEWDFSVSGFIRRPAHISKTNSSMMDISLDGNTDTNDTDYCYGQWVSDPLSAQTISSQTVKLQIRSMEENARANQYTAISIRVIASDSATVRGTILSLTRDNTELAVSTTTPVNRQFSATTSSVTASAGDRIVIEIGAGGNPDTGSGGDSHDADLRVGDSALTDLPENDTDTNDYNPWVEFANTVNFAPAPPTNVSATDGTYTDKVTITWTKSTGATGYKVYEGTNLLDTLGDVATYDDTAAPAPTITAGSANATDGTSTEYVTLTLTGESANPGTSRTYKVVATNSYGDSDDSNTDTGYRGAGTLQYQWQRSADDSASGFSDITGATTDPYNDTGAPADGSGRYYQCVLTATGATSQTSSSDRGYRATETSGISISGICDQLDNSDCSDTGTIRVAYDGTLQTQTQPTVGGAWTVINLPEPASSNVVITIYIEGAADANEAVNVSKYDGTGDVSGIVLTETKLSIGSDDNRTGSNAITNADISSYDYSASGSNEDIFIDVDSNNDLTTCAIGTCSDNGITIKASNEYRPDSSSSGNVTTHDITNYGTFTADNNSISASGSWTNSGTFTANGSTVSFTGTGADETLGGTTAGTSFYNLTVDKSGKILSLSNTITVGNNLSVIAGTLDDGGYQITGNATGVLTASSGASLSLGSASSATVFPTSFTNGNCSLNSASTVIYKAGTAQTISVTPTYGNLSFLPTITGAVSYTFAGAATINGDFMVNPTAVTTNTLTVYLAGTTTVASGKTTTLSGTTAGLSALDTVNGSDYSFSSGFLNIAAAGTFIPRNSTVTLTGTTGTIFTRTGTFDISQGASTIVFSQTTGDTTLTSGSIAFDNTQVNMSGRTGTLGNTVTFGGTLTVTAGTLDTSSSSYTVTAGNVSIGSTGTLYGRGSTINVTGDWSNSGTYTYETSTVAFNGTGSQQISGSTNFYRLSITASSARTVTFVHNSIISLYPGGTLTLTGVSGGLLTLQSDSTEPWYLHVSRDATTVSVSYVNVSLSNAGGYKKIDASNGTNTDGGSNINWFFVSTATVRTNFSGVHMTGVNINASTNTLCPTSFTIDHKAINGVAPVDKTVTYTTVVTDLTGTNKCWITKNLGATDEASSATDSDESSAGWYWQFNRKQGYMYDTSRVPNTTWIGSITEDTTWRITNDPCALEFGTGWRLPNSTELNSIDTNGGWDNYTETYASVLKLHAAGYLDYSSGALTSRGSEGYIWSSTDQGNINGESLHFNSTVSEILDDTRKASGYPVRCVRDL